MDQNHINFRQHEMEFYKIMSSSSSASSASIFNKDIEQYLKEPLKRVKPLWEDFPGHSEEFFQLISILPRQSFDLPPNKFSQSIHSIEKTTADESLKIRWNVHCLLRKI